MTRLMLMTFFTDKRWEEGVHPHESPKVMTVPLIVLAALSVLGGVMLIGDWIVDFLEPVTGTAPDESPPIPALAISRDRARGRGRRRGRGVVLRRRSATCPARHPQDVSLAGPGRSRRALRQRDQRQLWSYARAQLLTPA